MTTEEWSDAANHVVGMLIRGEATDDIDERGRTARGTAILLLLNGGARSRSFALPTMERPGAWIQLLDTAHPAPRAVRGSQVHLAAHSLMLLQHEAAR